MLHKIYSYITPTENGLVLGDETVIVRRRQDGALAIDGHEEEILGLLSVAYGKLVPARVLSKLRAATLAYSKTPANDWGCSDNPGRAPDFSAGEPPSPKLLTLMHLALTGLNRAEAIEANAPYLAQAQKIIAGGIAPLDLLKAVGLAPPETIFLFDKGYNPDEPRDARGRWTSGGDSDDTSEGSGDDSDGDNAQDGHSSAPQQPADPEQQVAGDRTKDECRELCSEYAIPTGEYNGTSFFRCMDQCEGKNNWEEWEQYFPSNS